MEELLRDTQQILEKRMRSINTAARECIKPPPPPPRAYTRRYVNSNSDLTTLSCGILGRVSKSWATPLFTSHRKLYVSLTEKASDGPFRRTRQLFQRSSRTLETTNIYIVSSRILHCIRPLSQDPLEDSSNPL